MAGLLTLVRDLGRRKARERRGLSVAEGVRLVEEARAAHLTVRGAVFETGAIADERVRRLRDALEAEGVPVEGVAERTFRGLADTDTPQGVLAVVETRAWTLTDVDVANGGVVLVLDAVQDPGNAGGVIRSAAALGAAGTLCLSGTVDPWNGKALRSAMGATFRHPVVSVTAEQLETWIEAERVTLWATDQRGEAPRDARAPARLALAVGNEGSGVSDSVRRLARRTVGIPLVAGVESLNVGVAAGILLYEVLNR